jgi:DNA-binding MarR family transcriptional regulator
MTERFIRDEASAGAERHGAGRAEGTASRHDDVRRRRSPRRRASGFGPRIDRSAVKRSIHDPAVEDFVDALDRERLAPVEILLLLRVAASEATVVELAAALDRDPAAIRRAAAGLVGRGLLRQRAARRGLVLEMTPSGLAALSRLAEQLELAPRSHG